VNKLLWFKHDSDASQDAKMKKLILRYGAEGYAVYFHCIELIVGDINESKLTFELEHDSEIIADNLKIQGDHSLSGIDKVNAIMRYIVELDLFKINNGHIYCYKLLKRLDQSMTSNKKLRDMIETGKKNHDTVMIESCQRHDKVMQEENRIEENRIEEKKESHVFAESSDEYLLSKLLYTEHLKHDEKFLHGKNLEDTFQRWSDPIDKIMRLDGRTVDQVRQVIIYAQDSKFWNANILSGKTLRDQFSKLYGLMVSDSKYQPKATIAKYVLPICPECGKTQKQQDYNMGMLYCNECKHWSFEANARIE
jgi:hypothetical protein